MSIPSLHSGQQPTPADNDMTAQPIPTSTTQRHKAGGPNETNDTGNRHDKDEEPNEDQQSENEDTQQDKDSNKHDKQYDKQYDKQHNEQHNEQEDKQQHITLKAEQYSPKYFISHRFSAHIPWAKTWSISVPRTAKIFHFCMS